MEAVRASYPSVTLIRGDGNLFWAGGMRLAQAVAEEQPAEFYLWLNDDIVLYPNAIFRLLESHASLAATAMARAIIVGSTQDPRSGVLTYGGWLRRSGCLLARLEKAEPPLDRPAPCDTFNGNCVLVPRVVVDAIGGLDPRFPHAMADLDYGFRAASAGCTLWVLPGFAGTCVSNDGRDLWTEVSLPFGERWRRLVGPKGLPPRPWLTFTRRHSGPLWPCYWLSPYVRLCLSGLLRIGRS